MSSDRRRFWLLEAEENAKEASTEEKREVSKDDPSVVLNKLKEINKYDEWVKFLDDALNTDYKGVAFKDYLEKAYTSGAIPTTYDNLAEEKSISISNLHPTQDEVFIKQSLEYPLKNKETLVKLLNGKDVKIGPSGKEMPIITFDDKYVIDGHHRWSETYCINPKATMKAINFKKEGNITPTDVLKAMQLSIAAKKGDIPHSSGDGINLFTVDETNLKKYVFDTIDMNAVGEAFKNFNAELDSAEKIADYIWGNVEELKKNCQPMEGASSRYNMPQTDSETLELAQDQFIDITENINLENTKMENKERITFDLREAFDELDELWSEDEEVFEDEVLGEDASEDITNEDEFLADEAENEVEEEAEEVDEVEEAEEEQTEVSAETVEDFINELKEYDGKFIFEIKPIVIDGKEYNVESLEFDDSEDGKVSAYFNFIEKVDEINADEENEEVKDESNTQEEIEEEEIEEKAE